MSEHDTAIAQRLIDARKAKGYTVSEVARMRMMSPMVLQRIEAGTFSPVPLQVESLARIYGVSIAWIMSGDDTEPALEPTKVTPFRVGR